MRKSLSPVQDCFFHVLLFCAAIGRIPASGPGHPSARHRWADTQVRPYGRFATPAPDEGGHSGPPLRTIRHASPRRGRTLRSAPTYDSPRQPPTRADTQVHPYVRFATPAPDEGGHADLPLRTICRRQSPGQAISPASPEDGRIGRASCLQLCEGGRGAGSAAHRRRNLTIAGTRLGRARVPVLSPVGQF